MGSIFKRSFFIICLVLVFLKASGQTREHPLFREKGFLTGAGYGVNSQSLPQGKYIPVFFIGHLGIELLSARKKVRAQMFTLFFEPQVNLVVIQKPGTNGRAMEAGLNVGVQHMFPLTRNLYFYALISTGPHMITVRTDIQARGFIFSDNMGAGTYLMINKNLALNTGFRIRHMSNANLVMPNHGINTMNFFVGISRLIR